ncbi:MAG: LysR family transcriptional regulator [Clostridiales bacterium]|nr:LysR family transcriptional regulator [Clostridiales bacterium]
MNTQKIKVFLKAIELGSLTAAGDELGYTQPAITQMMRSLEKEIGFPLLVKSRSGVEPTMEAQLLIPTMRLILSNEEKLDQEIGEIMGMHKGTIRIGTFASTSIHWLPKVLDCFQSNYPDVVFDITECSQSDMVEGIKNGSMDLALMSSQGTGDIEFIPISEEPMYAVFSENHELASLDSVPISSLNDYPLIIESFDQDTYAVFKKAGITPAAKYFSKDCVAILSMVKQGVGVSVLPALILEQFPGAYEYRLLDPPVNRTLGIGVRDRKSCGPLARFIIKFIREKI